MSCARYCARAFCSRTKFAGVSVLRVPILVLVLLACDGRGTPSTREARSGEFLGSDLDNQGLVQGPRLAILLSGLFKPRVTDDVALPSLLAHVIEPLGERNVDVFVNSEPAHGATIAAAEKAFRLWIPAASLQSLVLRPGVAPPQLLADAHSDSEWVERAVLCRREAQPRGLFVSQYERLRDLYGLVLGQEARRGERYRHVVRMRTDTVWVRDWPHLAPGESLPLPSAAIAGPFFDQAGILLDHFFICAREVSWACFYEAPVLFQRPWLREELHVASGCHRVPRHDPAHLTCHKSIFGINSTWPEAILTGFFRRMVRSGSGRGGLVDSCAVTGEFVVNSRNSPLLRPCEGTAMSQSEDVAIAEVERYFEVDMWL